MPWSPCHPLAEPEAVDFVKVLLVKAPTVDFIKVSLTMESSDGIEEVVEEQTVPVRIGDLLPIIRIVHRVMVSVTLRRSIFGCLQRISGFIRLSVI